MTPRDAQRTTRPRPRPRPRIQTRTAHVVRRQIPPESTRPGVNAHAIGSGSIRAAVPGRGADAPPAAAVVGRIGGEERAMRRR